MIDPADKQAVVIPQSTVVDADMLIRYLETHHHARAGLSFLI